MLIRIHTITQSSGQHLTKAPHVGAWDVFAALLRVLRCKLFLCDKHRCCCSLLFIEVSLSLSLVVHIFEVFFQQCEHLFDTEAVVERISRCFVLHTDSFSVIEVRLLRILSLLKCPTVSSRLFQLVLQILHLPVDSLKQCGSIANSSIDGLIHHCFVVKHTLFIFINLYLLFDYFLRMFDLITHACPLFLSNPYVQSLRTASRNLSLSDPAHCACLPSASSPIHIVEFSNAFLQFSLSCLLTESPQCAPTPSPRPRSSRSPRNPGPLPFVLLFVFSLQLKLKPFVFAKATYCLTNLPFCSSNSFPFTHRLVPSLAHKSLQMSCSIFVAMLLQHSAFFFLLSGTFGVTTLRQFISDSLSLQSLVSHTFQDVLQTSHWLLDMRFAGSHKLQKHFSLFFRPAFS